MSPRIGPPNQPSHAAVFLCRFQDVLPLRCLLARGVLVVVLGGVLGCGKFGASEAERNAVAFRNVATDTEYVGDAACFSCHEEVYTGYQEHGMARSFYPHSAENRVEDIEGVRVYHEPSGFYYTVIEEGEGVYQEEFRLASDGRKTHRLRRRMDYVVGSGNAARTYLTQSKGRLYELPLTWYIQKKQWDFSPGYAAENVRFDRLIPDRCIACHNSYPEEMPFVTGKYTTVPEGIGCERCHGPGALHVEERLAAPEPAGDVDDTIVNPAHLSFERRLDVCNQCHLNTTVAVLREGRSDFSFRPSEALSDHLALFVAREDAGGEGIEVVSHAERMQQSACFLGTRASAQPLECITCHNPHEGFRDQGPRYFNATCMQCHDTEALRSQIASVEDHEPDANCIACHMPKVAASDAPHSSFTDHWIRVVGGDPATATAEAEAEIMEPYFERDRGNREGQRYLGMALIVHGRQQNNRRLMVTGAATLEVGLGADTTQGEAYFLLGVAHQLLGNLEGALLALERAVRIDPGIPQRLNALAQAYEAAQRDPTLIDRLYQRALRIQPALAEVRVNYGHFLQAQGRLPEALEAYEAALAEQPWLDIAPFLRGTALVELDRRAEAEQAFRAAVQLNPDYANILGHLLFFRTVRAAGRQGEERLTDVRVSSPIPEVALDEPETKAIRIVPNLAGEAAAARFINLPTNATVQIYTRQGTLLRALEKQAASSFLPWDLRTEAGLLVPSGLYLIHVRAKDPSGRALWTRVIRWAAVRQRVP